MLINGLQKNDEHQESYFKFVLKYVVYFAFFFVICFLGDLTDAKDAYKTWFYAIQRRVGSVLQCPKRDKS